MAEEDDPAKIMGFASFGGTKKARQFDFMSMFQESVKTAQEHSHDKLAERELEYSQMIQEDPDVSQTKQPNKSQLDLSNRKPQKTQTSQFKPIGYSESVSKEDTGTESSKSSEEEQDDFVGPPVPSSFPGKMGEDNEDNDEHAIAGPSVADQLKMKSTADSDSDEEEEDDDNPTKKIPNSHKIILQHGDKPVSALALDPSGARLCTGSYDYDLKFWDFAGMDGSLRSFRQLRPCESHQIKSLDYSTSGENILVVAGNAQAKVLDRDGYERFECVKGYQYIVDQASTKGHTGMLNGGCWHPRDRNEFLTCSIDGSVRIWDVNVKGRAHKGIMKPKNPSGRRTFPTACCYSRDGRWIAAACQDGSIQIWDHNKHTFVNVAMQNKSAHQNGSDTSCLCFSYDGKTLASRGGDDTLKLWDIRNFKKPLAVASDLENIFPVTDCLFSPDDQLVVTGVSVKRGTGVGKLIFMDKQNLQTVQEIAVTEGESVVRCLWHPKLNQIVAGTGDGAAKLYYNPKKSHRGALLCTLKRQKKTQQVEAMIEQAIITPYALPMYREAKPVGTKRREEKARKDPVKSKRPEIPHVGAGQGGRLGAKGATLSQYVSQTIAKRLPDERDKDPRGAILRHAEEASQNPYWIDPAYKDTQPTSVFADPAKLDAHNKVDEDLRPVWKKLKTDSDKT